MSVSVLRSVSVPGSGCISVPGSGYISVPGSGRIFVLGSGRIFVLVFGVSLSATTASTAAPRLRPLRLLLPDCGFPDTFFTEFEVK